MRTWTVRAIIAGPDDDLPRLLAYQVASTDGVTAMLAASRDLDRTHPGYRLLAINSTGWIAEGDFDDARTLEALAPGAAEAPAGPAAV